MQYRIKVMLPEVYYESICRWQPIHWESKLMELDEEERKAVIKDLSGALKSNSRWLRFEDDSGDMYIIPSKLLERCVITLVKHRESGWYASASE